MATEDDDYREKLSGPRRSFAGAKGVGRFSSDRLGKRLLLCSKAAQHPVQHAEIDWTLYELDAKEEFRTVKSICLGECGVPAVLTWPTRRDRNSFGSQRTQIRMGPKEASAAQTRTDETNQSLREEITKISNRNYRNRISAPMTKRMRITTRILQERANLG